MEGCCKDCVFWKPLIHRWSSYHEYEYVTSQGECFNEKFVYNYGQPPEKANDEFLMIDDFESSVDFYPCAHFGCIHFQARP